jgi:hypothetical protein
VVPNQALKGGATAQQKFSKPAPAAVDGDRQPAGLRLDVTALVNFAPSSVLKIT